MKTQNELILKHLQSGKPITGMFALQKFGCARLASRIWDIRQKGFNVKSRLIETDSGKWISQYSL